MPDNQDSKEPYNYALGQRLLEKFYPYEVCHGGIIDFVDCGELHSLLARYHKEQLAATQQSLEAMKIGMKENQAWAKNAISDYGIIKGQLDSAVEALEAILQRHSDALKGGEMWKAAKLGDIMEIAKAALASIKE